MSNERIDITSRHAPHGVEYHVSRSVTGHGRVLLATPGGGHYVDGQKLANALARLGYIAEHAPEPLGERERELAAPPVHDVSARLDRLTERVAALEGATRVGQHATGNEPVGSLLTDTDGDVWRVHTPGCLSYGRTVRYRGYNADLFHQVNRAYGPLVVTEVAR